MALVTDMTPIIQHIVCFVQTLFFSGAPWIWHLLKLIGKMSCSKKVPWQNCSDDTIVILIPSQNIPNHLTTNQIIVLSDSPICSARLIVTGQQLQLLDKSEADTFTFAMSPNLASV